MFLTQSAEEWREKGLTWRKVRSSGNVQCGWRSVREDFKWSNNNTLSTPCRQTVLSFLTVSETSGGQKEKGQQSRKFHSPRLNNTQTLLSSLLRCLKKMKIQKVWVLNCLNTLLLSQKEAMIPHDLHSRRLCVSSSLGDNSFTYSPFHSTILGHV